MACLLVNFLNFRVDLSWCIFGLRIDLDCAQFVAEYVLRVLFFLFDNPIHVVLGKVRDCIVEQSAPEVANEAAIVKLLVHLDYQLVERFNFRDRLVLLFEFKEQSVSQLEVVDDALKLVTGPLSTLDAKAFKWISRVNLLQTVKLFFVYLLLAFYLDNEMHLFEMVLYFSDCPKDLRAFLTGPEYLLEVCTVVCVVKGIISGFICFLFLYFFIFF